MRCRYDCFTFVSELRSSDGFAALTEQDILGNFSGIISGVLAYAFDTVSGSHGLSGWQWYAFFVPMGCSLLIYGFSGSF